MGVKKEKRKWYDASFKAKAIAMAEEIGPARASSALGIAPCTMTKWLDRKRHMKERTPQEQELAAARWEIQKLKRENSDLKKANIILKELSSVFSKDYPNTNLEWSLNSQKSLKKER